MKKTTVSIRGLRDRFPQVRKLVEAEGEVVLTVNNRPPYRLSLYIPGKARVLDEGNRGGS